MAGKSSGVELTPAEIQPQFFVKPVLPKGVLGTLEVKERFGNLLFDKLFNLKVGGEERMTLKNLLSVAIAVALMNSQALAQVSSQDASGDGPTVFIDLLRNEAGNPVVDATTGGLTYVVSVAPDTTQPVFGAGAGPNGAGASVALELGFTVGGAGLASDVLSSELPVGAADAVTVNLNSSPGVGTTATEPDDGFVDFANPGNSIFGFEVANITTDDGLQIGGVQASGNDVFAALGTTFFSSPTNGPYEVLTIQTGALDSDEPTSLSPSLALNVASIAAQSIDLSDAANPVSQVFNLVAVTDADTVFAGDANLDGTIDLLDLALFGGGAFNNPVAGGFGAADFNNDGVLDLLDLSALGGGVFNTTPGVAPVVGATTVPEPTTAVLTLLLGIAAAARRSAR